MVIFENCNYVVFLRLDQYFVFNSEFFRKFCRHGPDPGGDGVRRSSRRCPGAHRHCQGLRYGNRRTLFVNFYIYDLSAQFYSHSKLFRPKKIGNIVPFQIFLNQNIFSPEQTQAF